MKYIHRRNSRYECTQCGDALDLVPDVIPHVVVDDSHVIPKLRVLNNTGKEIIVARSARADVVARRRRLLIVGPRHAEAVFMATTEYVWDIDAPDIGKTALLVGLARQQQRSAAAPTPPLPSKFRCARSEPMCPPDIELALRESGDVDVFRMGFLIRDQRQHPQ